MPSSSCSSKRCRPDSRLAFEPELAEVIAYMPARRWGPAKGGPAKTVNNQHTRTIYQTHLWPIVVSVKELPSS